MSEQKPSRMTPPEDAREPFWLSRKCAGYQCPDRSDCYRYLRPMDNGQRWASFDIERNLFGSCESQLPVKGRKFNMQVAEAL